MLRDVWWGKEIGGERQGREVLCVMGSWTLARGRSDLQGGVEILPDNASN